MVIDPQKSPDTYVGTYPLIYEKLKDAYNVYHTCLDGHFRIVPVLSTSILLLIVGSVVYTFAGPLVILSRSAFYHCSMLGAVLLAFFVLLNHAACSFLDDCLRRSQSTRFDNHGTYVENIYDSTLFDITAQMGNATTTNVTTYLTILGFLPIAIMGSLVEKILGRPV